MQNTDSRLRLRGPIGVEDAAEELRRNVALAGQGRLHKVRPCLDHALLQALVLESLQDRAGRARAGLAWPGARISANLLWRVCWNMARKWC